MSMSWVGVTPTLQLPLICMTLASSTSWGLKWNPGFTFTASDNALIWSLSGNLITQMISSVMEVYFTTPLLDPWLLVQIHLAKPIKFGWMMGLGLGFFPQLYLHQLSFGDGLLYNLRLSLINFETLEALLVCFLPWGYHCIYSIKHSNAL